MATGTLLAAPEAPRWTALRRYLPYVVVYGLIAALLVIGTVNSERFLTERNLMNVLRQSVFIGVAALGQTLVILSGGIDLSVGSVVKLSVLVSALVMNGDANNIVPAVLASVAIGVVVGLAHATIITRLNVAPFIVTLGTYSIIRGIAYNISTAPIGRAAPSVVQFYDVKLGPFHVLTLIFFILLVILMFVLRRTRFGRYVYAVGGNEQVARLSGVPVTKVRYGVYILCSTLAALAGLFALVRSGVGDPITGEGLELQTITAVVIGGTSLFGGRGGLMGTLGGVLLMGLIGNVMVVADVDRFARPLIEGSIIVAAVALYKQKARK